MLQIVSSAITNQPPPDGAVRVQQWFSRAGLLNKHTRTLVDPIFRDHK
jgi:hypothetical protein